MLGLIWMQFLSQACWYLSNLPSYPHTIPSSSKNPNMSQSKCLNWGFTNQLIIWEPSFIWSLWLKPPKGEFVMLLTQPWFNWSSLYETPLWPHTDIIIDVHGTWVLTHVFLVSSNLLVCYCSHSRSSTCDALLNLVPSSQPNICLQIDILSQVYAEQHFSCARVTVINDNH